MQLTSVTTNFLSGLFPLCKLVQNGLEMISPRLCCWGRLVP